MDTQKPREVMNTGDAARYIGVTTTTLIKRRHADSKWEGPPFIRLAQNAVRYLKSDIDQWLREQRVVPEHFNGGGPMAHA